MKSKTTKTTKVTSKKKVSTKKPVKNSNIFTADVRELKIGTHEGQVFTLVPRTLEDFKNALLIVSLLVNLFLLIGWLVTRVSQDYAYVIASALI